MRGGAERVRGAVWFAAAGALVIACGPTQRSSPAPARVTTAPTIGPAGGDTEDPGSSADTGAHAVAAAAVDGEAEDLPPEPATSAPVPTTTRVPLSSDTAPAARSNGEILADDVPLDDPAFEGAPLQPLSFDVVELPADDAGVGGTISVPVTVPSSQPEPDDAAHAVAGWAGFDASLEAALMRAGNTAASVAVAIDGRIVHTAAFGERVPGTGDPTQPQDRFRIASISKPITAITLLTLVADGSVGLDEAVGRRIADHLGVGAIPSSSARLTVRQLLAHTSGFGKFDTQFFRNGSTDCRDAAATGLRSGAGGGGYAYSNMNYCVAGLLIEALTGESYETAVYQRLLTPLGISGMRLAPTIDPGPDEVRHVTTVGRNYMETLGAAGAWVATPSDLVRIVDSVDPWLSGWTPLPIELIGELLRPTGATFGERGYGLGMIMYGPARYGHTGTIENTHAMVQHRGDGVTWAVTVAGPHPASTPRLEGIVNAAFAAAGFVAG